MRAEREGNTERLVRRAKTAGQRICVDGVVQTRIEIQHVLIQDGCDRFGDIYNQIFASRIEPKGLDVFFAGEIDCTES